MRLTLVPVAFAAFALAVSQAGATEASLQGKAQTQTGVERGKVKVGAQADGSLKASTSAPAASGAAGASAATKSDAKVTGSANSAGAAAGKAIGGAAGTGGSVGIR